MHQRLALYPGTFDPFTLGHLDIVEKATHIFDTVEITVAVNKAKQTMFTLEERCTMIRHSTAHLAGVSVVMFEGLLVDYARKRQATALVRGLRQATDFDVECQMAFANRCMHGTLVTVFLVPSTRHVQISSSIVREILHWGGDVSHFVPPAVAHMLRQNT